MRVSVVIPVLNAAAYLPALLDALFAQQPAPPEEVVLVDSQSTDDTRSIAARYDRVRVVPVAEFTHGGARNLGAREARGDLVVLLTQDALPADPAWLARLTEPFQDAQLAAVYGRQIPRPDASPMERYFLLTHFPAGVTEKRVKKPGETLSFARVFFSNVNSAVRRDLLLRHPFDETLIMSEDQQLSRDLLEAGYAVAYVPGAAVVHSHNYTLPTVFRRYFDSVYSLTVIFPQHGLDDSASMGLRYLGREALYVARTSPRTLPYYLLYTAAKTLGTIAGHFAEKMPRSWLRRLSLHSYHWAEARAARRKT